MTDDTKAFEAEAAETRNRIAVTIDQLQSRLSPKALVDNAMDSLSSAGKNAVASVRGAATGHPLVLGAAGLAVGVGLLAGRRVSAATVEYGDSYAAYADYDDGYAANLAAGEPPRSTARAHLDAVQHQAHATVDDNPLAVVAIAVATGALLGAILPVSGAEAHILSDVRSRLAAAGDAAVAAAKNEMATVKLSFTGGTAGISAQLTQALVRVLGEAGSALGHPVSSGSADGP